MSAPGLLGGALVAKGDHALRIGYVFDEVEFAMGKAAGKKRNASADQCRYNADVEFINQIFFQEFSNEDAAAHEPDVFAGVLANFGNDGAGRIIRDQDAIAHAERKGPGE